MPALVVARIRQRRFPVRRRSFQRRELVWLDSCDENRKWARSQRTETEGEVLLQGCGRSGWSVPAGTVTGRRCRARRGT
ncbi:hypothetical protein C7U60_11155 [Mesorhizobium plurifarium]|nr:hypothetical protein C7U60_11155 [Mesorhizobium plurifarium]